MFFSFRPLGLVLLLLFTPTLWAEPERLALVIGNGDYPRRPLSNPGNDADDVSAALKGYGFQVITRKNLRLGEMRSAINDFGGRLNNNTVGLIFFAGHGVVDQDGRSFLLPIGADEDVSKPEQLASSAVDVEFMLGAMEGGLLNMIFLDACRTNPFSDRPAFRKRGTTDRGLSPLIGRKFGRSDTLISYATADGNAADDSDYNGRNSPYTASLLKWMKEPLPIELVLKQVRSEVMEKTEGRQRPIYNPEFTQDFSFQGSETTLTGSQQKNEGAKLSPEVEKKLAAAERALVNEEKGEFMEIIGPLVDSGKLEEAVMAGSARAKFIVGAVSFFNVEEDKVLRTKALLLMEEAADAGNVNAQVLLGVIYGAGKVVAEDKKKARELWEQAADAGNPKAQYLLGKLYDEGAGGLDKDEKKARELWEKAAAAGDDDAQTSLGTLYYLGEGGLTEDKEKARELWEKAAAAGDGDAQAWLGLLYVKGEGGLAKNEKKARELWEKAAASGNEKAKKILEELSK